MHFTDADRIVVNATGHSCPFLKSSHSGLVAITRAPLNTPDTLTLPKLKAGDSAALTQNYHYTHKQMAGGRWGQTFNAEITRAFNFFRLNLHDERRGNISLWDARKKPITKLINR